jgi:hypothetical protein
MSVVRLCLASASSEPVNMPEAEKQAKAVDQGVDDALRESFPQWNLSQLTGDPSGSVMPCCIWCGVSVSSWCGAQNGVPKTIIRGLEQSKTRCQEI